ncbi:hypothetical protein W97_08481 [Coniosporium apollinis CBS 100218]|uniref:Uncharacterized protein n=1 Tax=Coniosporium apollinis (strain CBS 100218) TaxID=1168221 RepID=R7Z4X6_CONA1|nr:uncharacterized protein W97_08481 [Coniosporium apollinis CBS 100218]EON69222.1 hypothetical protein W97_08481 [Coniosporium apollinis CBS 100218]
MSAQPPAIYRDGFMYFDSRMHLEVRQFEWHARATASELRALLLSGPVPPSKEKPVMWWEAQMRHYGFAPTKYSDKNKAKVKLARLLTAGTLAVPEHILKIEEGMREEYVEAAKRMGIVLPAAEAEAAPTAPAAPPASTKPVDAPIPAWKRNLLPATDAPPPLPRRYDAAFTRAAAVAHKRIRLAEGITEDERVDLGVAAAYGAEDEKEAAAAAAAEARRRRPTEIPGFWGARYKITEGKREVAARRRFVGGGRRRSGKDAEGGKAAVEGGRSTGESADEWENVGGREGRSEGEENSGRWEAEQGGTARTAERITRVDDEPRKKRARGQSSSYGPEAGAESDHEQASMVDESFTTETLSRVIEEGNEAHDDGDEDDEDVHDEEAGLKYGHGDDSDDSDGSDEGLFVR